MSATLAGAQNPSEPPAKRSSFYAAMRILPREQREAMYAVYAFCRAVDDVADGGDPASAKLAELDAWRLDLDRLYAGESPPRFAALAGPVRRFGLRREDFAAVIDGMGMDAAEDIRAPDAATLDLYCDRVASAVGRLSTPIFGLAEEPGRRLAHHLGRALQLTNVLRDLDEDAERGRLYLPRETLEAAGISARSPNEVLAHPGLDRACRTVAEQAAGHYGEADRTMAGCERRQVRAPRLMAAAYADVLARMQAQGWAPPRRRVSPGKLKLAVAALRHGLF